MSASEKLTPEQKKLVEASAWIAESMTRQFWRKAGQNPSDPAFQDLQGEAYLQLCVAAKQWDPQRGPFSAYARLIIKHKLGESRRSSQVIVHLPRDVRAKINRIERARKDGFTSIESVAKHLGLSEKVVAELWPYLHKGYVEIDPQKIHAEESDSHSLLVNAETIEEVRLAIAKLTPPQRKIVELRFGFKTGEMLTTAEIARRTNRKLETVRALEAEAMQALETELRALHLED